MTLTHLTDNQIEEMLTNELNENGEYINNVGGLAMSTLETHYSQYPQYDEIVRDNYNRFYIIAERIY